MDKKYLYRVAGDGELYRVQLKKGEPDNETYEWLSRSGYWEFKGVQCHQWVTADGPLVIETKLERKARLTAAKIVLMELAHRKPGKPLMFEKNLEIILRNAKEEDRFKFYKQGKIEGLKTAIITNEMYAGGEENFDWITEGYLYSLFGKDEARSILGKFRFLAVLLGCENPHRIF